MWLSSAITPHRMIVSLVGGTIFFILLGLNPSLDDFKRAILAPTVEGVRARTRADFDKDLPGIRALARAFLPQASAMVRELSNDYWASIVTELGKKTFRESLGIASFYTTKLDGCESIFFGVAGQFFAVNNSCGFQNAHNDPRN